MIPYGRQTIDEDDIRAVVEVLRSDRLTQGPLVESFESALAGACGAKRAIVFANGTVALQAAYASAGLGPGDELLTTAMTFVATSNAALWLGARPVFADVDSQTGNMDPRSAASLVTPRTKVLAPVDFTGRPADLDALRALARAKKLILIEDACHALGARYKGRAVGAISDMTVFSFHPVKSISTGEGGAVLTDDEGRAERLAAYRNHGFSVPRKDWNWDMTGLAVNGRLTDIQCALGVSQLKKLDRFIARRREHARAYARELAGLPQIELPPESEDSSWHLYQIRLRLEVLKTDRARIYSDLREAGIGVQVHYIPVYRHPYYRELGYTPKGCPNTEAYYERSLSIPLYPAMTDAQRAAVVGALKEVLSRHSRPESLPVPRGKP